MSRTVERLEGLALVGAATLGPVRISTPSLLESRREGESGPGFSVRAVPAPVGRRGLEIADPLAQFRIEVPILAPEIGGEGSGVYPAGPGAYLVHAPFQSEAAAAARAERPELGRASCRERV